jgi:hypothetical protein
MADLIQGTIDLFYEIKEGTSTAAQWTASNVGKAFQSMGYKDAPEDFKWVAAEGVNYYFLPLEKLDGRPPFLVFEIPGGKTPWTGDEELWTLRYNSQRQIEEYIKYILKFDAIPGPHPLYGRPKFATSYKAPLTFDEFSEQNEYSDWPTIEEFKDNIEMLAAVAWNSTRERITEFVDNLGEGNFDSNKPENLASWIEVEDYVKEIFDNLVELIKTYIERAKVINRIIDLWRDYRRWINAVVDGVPGRNLISPHFCLNNDVGFGGFLWDKYDEFSCQFSHQCS